MYLSRSEMAGVGPMWDTDTKYIFNKYNFFLMLSTSVLEQIKTLLDLGNVQRQGTLLDNRDCQGRDV